MIEPQMPNTSAPIRTWGWRTALRWLMVMAAIGVVAWILMRSGTALTPFIIGLVLAYLMVPLVGRLGQHMPRWAAILTVYLLTFGVIGLAFAFIVPPAIGQVEQFIQSVPGWYEEARAEGETLFAQFRREVSPEVQQQVDEQIANIQQTVQENASAWAQGVVGLIFSSVRTVFQTLTFLLGFLIIPFFLFYTLLDSQKLPNTINRMLHPRIRDDVWNVLKIIDTILGKYIRGQLILGLVIAVLSFVGLTVLNLLGFDVGFTILLAIVAGFGELIPVIGPILTAIPAIIVGATDGFQTAIWVTVLYLIIQQVENQVLVPRIVGNTLKLHPALLMALLVISSQIGGLLLVILSAPLAAIARDIFLYFHQRLTEPPVPAAVAISSVLDSPTGSSSAQGTKASEGKKSRTYAAPEQERTKDEEVPGTAPVRRTRRSRLT